MYTYIYIHTHPVFGDAQILQNSLSFMILYCSKQLIFPWIIYKQMSHYSCVLYINKLVLDFLQKTEDCIHKSSFGVNARPTDDHF